jgi:hypothetical protein
MVWLNILFPSYMSTDVQCVAVHIVEAHVCYQWPVDKTISSVDQPTTFIQRLDRAQQFQKTFDFRMPMLVDNMAHTFHSTYRSWPFCCFVFHQDHLVMKFESNKDTFYYDTNTIDQWLDRFKKMTY